MIMVNFEFNKDLLPDGEVRKNTFTHQNHTFTHFSPAFTHLVHISLIRIVYLSCHSGLPDIRAG